MAGASACNAPSVEKFDDLVLPKLTSSLHSTAEEDEENGQDPCPICLDEYRHGDEICWSHSEACLHVFHRECIIEWLIRHDECPICRQDFLLLEDIHDHGGEHTDEHNADGHDLEMARTNDMSSDEGSITDYQEPGREETPRFSLWSIFGNPRATSSRAARTYTVRRSVPVEPRRAIDGFTTAEESDDNSTSGATETVEVGQDDSSLVQSPIFGADDS